MTVNDAKGRVNDLPQMLDSELRYDTAAQWMRAEPLDPGNDLSGKPLPDMRRPLARVISLQVLKVPDR